MRTVDQLEMVETVLFTFGLTLSWRIIFDLWEQGSSSSGLARVGTALASLLFVVQLVLLLKYAINIRALVTGRSFGRFANLSQQRLQRRLSFLTERFGSHAPFWQYMVWLRQFLLTLTVWVTKNIVKREDDIKVGVVTCNPLEEEADDDDDAGNNATTTTNGPGTGCAPISAESLAAIWTHVAFSLLIFLVFWGLQVRTQPYVHAFQNSIESWLFAANLSLVSLGTPAWSKWPSWWRHSWPPRAPLPASEGLGLLSALVRSGLAPQTTAGSDGSSAKLRPRCHVRRV